MNARVCRLRLGGRGLVETVETRCSLYGDEMSALTELGDDAGRHIEGMPGVLGARNSVVNEGGNSFMSRSIATHYSSMVCARQWEYGRVLHRPS